MGLEYYNWTTFIHYIIISSLSLFAGWGLFALCHFV